MTTDDGTSPPSSGADAGAGTEAPVSTPSASSEATPSTPASPQAESFGDEFLLAGFEDLDPQTLGAEAPTEQTQAGADTISAQPGAAPAQPTAQAGQDSVSGQDTLKGITETQPSPKSVKPEASSGPEAPQVSATVDALLKTFSDREADMVQAIAPHYTLGEELIEEIQTDAAKALPKLMAMVQIRAVRSAIAYMQKIVPQMQAEGLRRHAAQQSAEQYFFQKFPQLNREKHGAQITAIAQAFRSQSPQMQTAELLDSVGKAVMAMNGLTQTPAATKPNGAAPFRPAQAGQVVSRQQVPQVDEFDMLGSTF